MPTKEEIKLWLKSEGLKYQWLADECKVSLQTVRAWLSYREIPSLHLLRIQSLMRPENFSDPLNLDNSKLYIEVSFDVQKKLEKMALNCGMTMSDFISRALEKIATDPKLSDQFNELLCGRGNKKSEDYFITSLRAAESAGDYTS